MATRILPPTEKLKQLFDYNPETGELTWRHRSPEDFASKLAYHRYKSLHAGKVAGWKARRDKSKGSAPKMIGVSIDGRNYAAHKIIWAIVHGALPEGMEIDHRNGDPWDNKIDNLRLSTHTQNIQNGRHRDRELPRGVYRKGDLIYAAIRVNKKLIGLGYFKSVDLAAEAYRVAAEKHFGEFARPPCQPTTH